MYNQGTPPPTQPHTDDTSTEQTQTPPTSSTNDGVEEADYTVVNDDK